MLPASLCGCEIAPYAIGAMGKLYTAIAKAIGPYSHATSNPMAFNLVDGPNLDPTEEVLVRWARWHLTADSSRSMMEKTHPHAHTLTPRMHHWSSVCTCVNPRGLEQGP